MILDWAWKSRMQLRGEAKALCKQANECMDKSDEKTAVGVPLWAKGKREYHDNLQISTEADRDMARGDFYLARADLYRTEAEQLNARASLMKAQGDELWTTAILQVHGNVMLTWEWVEERGDYRCKVGEGRTFEP